MDGREPDDVQVELGPIGDVDPEPGDVDERFSKAAVDAFLEEPESSEHPSHHYNQSRREWGDASTVATLLDQLDLDIDGRTITVFGGFTGEFAEALRQSGHEVIFTDPMQEWVDRAEQKGFEAVCCSVEGIPAEIVDKSDAFATFECYYPLSFSRHTPYDVLRMLTAPLGLLLAESEATYRVLVEDGMKGDLTTAMKPYAEWYEMESKLVTEGDLRLYHLYIPDAPRSKAVLDGQVIQALYRRGTPDSVTAVTPALVEQIAEDIRSDIPTVEIAIQTFNQLHRDLIGKLRQYIPESQLDIADKRFELDFYR